MTSDLECGYADYVLNQAVNGQDINLGLGS